MDVVSMHTVPPEPRREPSRKPGLQRHEYEPNPLTQSAFMSHRTSWVPHSFTSETGYRLVSNRRSLSLVTPPGGVPGAPPTCCGHRHNDGAAPASSDVSGDQPLQGGVDDPVDLQTSRFLPDLYPEDEERSGVQPAHARTHASATRATAGVTGEWTDRLILLEDMESGVWRTFS